MIYPIVVSKCLNIVPKTPMMFFQGGEIKEVSERFRARDILYIDTLY